MNTVPEEAYWKISKSRVKRLAFILILLLAVGVLATTCSLCSHVDYTGRARVSEILASLAPLKNEIAKQLQNDSSFRFAPALASHIPEKTVSSLAIEYRAVAPDGTITLFSRQLGTLIMIRPQVGPDGAIEWSCHGAATQVEILPLRCRNPFPVPP
ncbi:MAG: pilin [Azoarcus sp.]|jgi:hypothetical protein|nr:pilin [Azoarcus sp.]